MPNKKLSDITAQALQSSSQFYIQRSGIEGSTTFGEMGDNIIVDIDNVAESASYIRMTPAERTKLSNVAVGATAFELPVGTVLPYVGSTAPTNYVVCNGQQLLKTGYPTLWSILDSGSTSGVYDTGAESPGYFRVPDLQGRIPVGSGSGSGLTARTRGEMDGEEEHTLTEAEMPSHTHGIQWAKDVYDGVNDEYAIKGPGTDIYTGSTGGDDPHNNMQPFTVLNYIIKVL